MCFLVFFIFLLYFLNVFFIFVVNDNCLATKMKKNSILLSVLICLSLLDIKAQTVDYSVVAVPEEAGNQFVKITSDADCVCMPIVKRSARNLNWFSNRILDVSADGKSLAYLGARNNARNIFVKDLGRQGSSVQRTNRTGVIDFSYSPDGKYICFSESRGKTNQIFQTSAGEGYVCRQITNGSTDYSPVYSDDMSQIFFARQETEGVSIWSYNVENNFLSTYTTGMNPYPLKSEPAFVCARVNDFGKSEIWKVNYQTGTEECIVSDPEKSFTSPVLSPDGRWIVFVGSSKIETESFSYMNLDIYAVKTDGSSLVQLTYHAADDLSPVWSKDGKSVYFVSQRGSDNGTANVWKMNFNL